MTAKPGAKQMLALYRTMVINRTFEDRVYYLFLEGSMPGTIHLSQGQEAVAAGICAHLSDEDILTSTHRPHGHALAKGVSVQALMSELFAKKTGCCKGYGGSMHVGDMSVGCVPAIAIVAGGLPLAAGAALSFKMRKEKNVAVGFVGDGGTNEGIVHEVMNMAAIWNLPVVFIIENNLYGASTHIELTSKIGDLAKRSASYGMPGEVVDGNDVLAVYDVAGKAIQRARSGKGPTLIEAKTYRIGGHSRTDANTYRRKDEEKQWLAKDPIKLFEKKLIEKKLLDEKKIEETKEEIEAMVEAAIEQAQTDPSPSPEDVFNYVWCED